MANARIMLVEDEAVTAQDIRTSLEALGYEVPLEAASGAEAVRMAAEVKPDLILMDIVLDGPMNGIEAAAAIRQAHDIPIVYLTAHADAETVEQAKVTEPFGYLTKLCSQETLRSAIEVALYKSEADKERRKAVAEQERLIGELKSKQLALERQIATTKQMAVVVQENAANLDAILAAASEAVVIVNPEGAILAINSTAVAMFGKKKSLKLIGTPMYRWLPAGLGAARKARIDMAFSSRGVITFQDQRDNRYYSHTIYPVCARSGAVLRAIIFTQDITDRVVEERAILECNDELEHLVRARTTELEEVVRTLQGEIAEHGKTMVRLREREREMEKLTNSLQDANSGLAALLRRREEELGGLRDEVLAIIKKFLLPSMDKLKRSGLTDKQVLYLETIEANLSEVVTPLGRETLTLDIPVPLTKAELQVIYLIKQGKRTREIAAQLELSPRTVEAHRNNIRKKIRIPDRSETLRKFLISHF